VKFDRIKARNLGPFRDVDLDLSSISGQLVAVTGQNGAGKSTLLELLAGALYRQCPTRGTLASLATSRDAMLEVGCVNGARHTIRHLIDGVSAKGESLVLDASGAPVLTSGKVREFDAWAERHLPPSELLYSSSFAPQGRRGFLDLSPSERKRLLAQLLGLERYERMADAAREKAREAGRELHALNARVSELPAPDLAALKAQATAAEQRVKAAEADARAARTALERAKSAAGDAQRAMELAEQRKSAEARLSAAREQIAGIEQRIANNRALTERAAEIRAAVSRAAELEAEVSAAREAVAAAKAKLDVLRQQEVAARTALATARSAESAAEARVLAATRRLADREKVANAVEDLPELREHETALQDALTRAIVKVDQLSRLQLQGKDQRIEALRDGLARVVSTPSFNSAQAVAGEALDADSELSAELADAPRKFNEAKASEVELRRQLEAHRARIAEAERWGARAPDMEAAAKDHETAQMERKLAGAEVERLMEALNAARGALNTFDGVSAAEASLTLALSKLDGLADLRALAPRLDQAEARIEELTAQLPALQVAAATAEAEVAALPVVKAAGIPDLSDSERAVAASEEEEREYRNSLARAQTAIEQAEVALQRRAELLDQVERVASELSDWTRLSQDLGRDGLPALELDAALPELNAIANDLLHHCVGPRFTVELRSTRLDASGKRELEACEFRVIDTEKGRDAEADTYSGGECVICGEAVSLALTVLACRRAGVERPTLVRDESGAALDPANGRAYVAMLRRAASQIGADRVLFVSHTPELQELADARIVVANGTAVVHG
jgi:exonuclease SbcC